MARKKNTTFAGVSVFDCRVDAPTFKRIAESGIGDSALIFDRATGSNGETGLITHEGSGNGCPLGLPIASQLIGRSLNLTSPSTKDTSGGTGQTIIAPYVVRIPPGETTLIVEVMISDMAAVSPLGAHLRIVQQSTGTELADVQMTAVPFGTATMLTATVRELPAGYMLVFPTVDTDTISPGSSTVNVGRLECVIIRHDVGQAIGENAAGEAVDTARTTEARYDVQTPGAAEGLFHRNFDEALFTNEDALSSYELGGWNANLNSLDEYITGRPAGGGPDYTHVDHDGAGVADDVDPARVRFESHTRATYAGEGQVNLPIWCESFGAWLDQGKFVVNAAEPPTTGMLDWYAPWPISTASLDLRAGRFVMPDFQTGASLLKCGVLIGSEASAAVGNWSFRVATAAGVSAAQVPTAITGSGNTLWFVEITAIPFSPDTEETVTLRCSRSGAKGGINELAILGVCLNFQSS